MKNEQQKAIDGLLKKYKQFVTDRSRGAVEHGRHGMYREAYEISITARVYSDVVRDLKAIAATDPEEPEHSDISPIMSAKRTYSDKDIVKAYNRGYSDRSSGKGRRQRPNILSENAA